MTNQPNKEYAYKDFVDMIQKSWTYNRLTEDEKDRCIAAFIWVKNQNLLRGNYAARHDQLNALYHAFLLGVGYTGAFWREAGETAIGF